MSHTLVSMETWSRHAQIIDIGYIMMLVQLMVIGYVKLWRLITKHLKPWLRNAKRYVHRIFEIYNHEKIQYEI